MIPLFAGIAIAAGIFAASLWSLMQAVRGTGLLRHAHISAVIATLFAMAALSFQNQISAQIAGGYLAVSAAIALFHEAGWNRLFPLFQLLFAAALLAALPFTG